MSGVGSIKIQLIKIMVHEKDQNKENNFTASKTYSSSFHETRVQSNQHANKSQESKVQIIQSVSPQKPIQES